MGDWRERAACRESPNSDAWFTEPAESNEASVPYALGFCRACSMRVDCLEAALALDVRWGIWGGTTFPSAGQRPVPRTVGGKG